MYKCSNAELLCYAFDMTHEGNEAVPTGKEEVIEALLRDPENLAPLQEYLAAREAACRNGADNLRLTLDLLDIYIAGGETFRDAAWDTLDAALNQAEGEADDTIVGELRLRQAKLEGE